MQVIHRSVSVMIAASLLFLYSQGLCQENKKEEISWDDIDSTGGQAGIAAQASSPSDNKKTAPIAAPESVKPQVKQTRQQETTVAPEAKKEPAQEAPIEVKKEVAPAAKKPKPKAEVVEKKSTEAKKEPKPEGKWKRANTITSEDASINRDIFVTNPNRE